MADDRRLWGYPEVAAHLGISVGATRSHKSRGSLPSPDNWRVIVGGTSEARAVSFGSLSHDAVVGTCPPGSALTIRSATPG